MALSENEASLQQKLVRRVIAAATMAASDLVLELRDATPKDRPKTAFGWSATAPTFDGIAVEFRIRHPQSEDAVRSGAAQPPAIEWLLKGTRPHVIMPRKAKALRFTVGGEVVFATKVNHPGTTGHDFVSGSDGVLTEANVEKVFRNAFARTS